MLGLLGGLRAAIGDHANRDPLSDFWFQAVTVMSSSGVAVTASNALRVPAVFDCLQALAKPLGSLPLIVYRLNDDGSKTRLPDHPVARLFRDGPNDEDTGLDWRTQLQWDLGLYKNCYSLITPELGAGDTFFASMRRLHPSLVTPDRRPDGTLFYRVRNQFTGTASEVSADQIWHLKASPFTDDGLAGVPVIQTGTGRDVIGAALALMEFTARFFRNDTTGGAIVEHPGSFKSDPDRQRAIEELKAARTGANAWRTLILEFGMKWVSNPIDAEKSQMNETRKTLGIEIAQIWGVPPHKIGLLDKATNNNIEQQALEFVIDCLTPWLVLWEHRIKKNLIVERDVFAEYDVISLLRGDLKSRYEAFAIARNWGWLSANDIRKLENMNPIEGGDVYLSPLNMAPSSGQRAPTPGPSRELPAPDPGQEREAPGDVAPTPSGDPARPAGPTEENDPPETERAIAPVSDSGARLFKLITGGRAAA